MVHDDKVLPEFIPIFLRLVRDIVACFTMCILEGIYWADVSLDKHVEDQPFPLSFVPTERVFGKDDCEGRATQVQHMKLLFIQLWKCAEMIGHDNLLKLIMDMQSTTACLSMSNNEMSKLLQCCCLLGKLFSLPARRLEVETTIGDVHFGSLRDGVHTDVVGHSFAMVLYKTDNDEVHQSHCDHVCVIETTGWERLFIPTWDMPLNQVEKYLISKIPLIVKQCTSHDNNVNVCSFMTAEMEKSVYQDILLGHDSIYFTVNSPLSPPRRQPPHFGSHLDMIKRSLLYYPENEITETTKTFRISTRDFIQELCVNPPPNTNTNKTKRRIWRAVAGAEEMLHEFDIIQVRYIIPCMYWFFIIICLLFPPMIGMYPTYAPLPKTSPKNTRRI